jgi:hypothetical protein
LSREDKKGRRPHPNWLCEGFQNAVSDRDLTDIQIEDYPFTWIKSRRSPYVIEERLDRAMTNTNWLSVFPDVKLLNLVASHSDHSPILIQSSPTIRNGNSYSFKFENVWLQEDNIKELVAEGMIEGENLDVTNKISQCTDKLQGWGRRKRM